MKLPKLPVVVISKNFIEKIAMPVFEEGLFKEQERAFALYGTVSDDEIKITSWKKVPEKNCRRDRFIRPKYRNVLGYLHTHPKYTKTEYSFVKTWVSDGDYKEMTAKKELLCGICFLPIDDFKNGMLHATIVFWHYNLPITLPIRMDDELFYHGIYLNRQGSMKWKIWKVKNI